MSKTTIAVETFLRKLQATGSDSAADQVVRLLLSKACERLSVLCRVHLLQRYPRLAGPPLNLEADELLSAAVERLIKAMRSVRPDNARQFFSLANQHIRWELNEFARRLDEQPVFTELNDVAASLESDSGLNLSAQRILRAIEELPDEQREVFELIRIQGLQFSEAAEILNVSQKTIQRRLNRALVALHDQLSDFSK